jgi:hypothetical protein
MAAKNLERCTVVSLDQCFLSRMAIPRQKSADFKQLLIALSGIVRTGRVVCPAHVLETIYESVKLGDFGRTRKVVRLQNQLAKGYAFHVFYELLAREMVRLVRPGFEYPRFEKRPIKLECDALLEFKRERLRLMDDRARKDTIYRLPYPPKDYKPGTSFQQILEDVETERETAMRVVLNAIALGGSVPKLKPDWMKGVEKSLLEQNVTTVECRDLLDKVDEGKWRDISVLKVNSKLFAKIEQAMLESGRKWSLNDHADIYRLCVSFVHADIVTCDGPMRDIIKQTGLEKEYPVKVFSIAEPEKLVKHLHVLAKF